MLKTENKKEDFINPIFFFFSIAAYRALAVKAKVMGLSFHKKHR